MTLNPGNIPLNLRNARERRNWTQEELAKRTGLKATAISHFERGSRLPSIWNFCRLCTALNVWPNQMLD